MPEMPREILTPKEIQQMLKLIPNNFPVCLKDLEEIFKNEWKTNRNNARDD